MGMVAQQLGIIPRQRLDPVVGCTRATFRQPGGNVGNDHRHSLLAESAKGPDVYSKPFRDRCTGQLPADDFNEVRDRSYRHAERDQHDGGREQVGAHPASFGTR